MACPRCGSPTCVDPDSKACSDNCILRLQDEVARLRADQPRLQREAFMEGVTWANSIPFWRGDAMSDKEATRRYPDPPTGGEA